MANLVIAKDFLDSLADLPRAVSAQVRKMIDQFERDPNHPSLHREHYKVQADPLTWLHDRFRGYLLGTLVAFSGEVNDPQSLPEPVTENSAKLNPNLKGRDMREAFATDEYQILLVANKFQTGFDAPLLETHTTMSTQALGSEVIRDGLRDILLGPAKLYETLRKQIV